MKNHDRQERNHASPTASPRNLEAIMASRAAQRWRQRHSAAAAPAQMPEVYPFRPHSGRSPLHSHPLVAPSCAGRPRRDGDCHRFDHNIPQFHDGSRMYAPQEEIAMAETMSRGPISSTINGASAMSRRAEASIAVSEQRKTLQHIAKPPRSSDDPATRLPSCKAAAQVSISPNASPRPYSCKDSEIVTSTGFLDFAGHSKQRRATERKYGNERG